jgi:hypothetical protein
VTAPGESSTPWARAPPQIDVDPIVRRTGGERKSKSAPEYRSRQRSARKAKRRAQTNLRQVAVSAPVFENPGEANAAGDCGWARIFAAKWREAVGCGRRGADPGCLRIGPTEKQLPINRLWSDYEAGIPSGQAQNRMLSVNNPIADQARQATEAFLPFWVGGHIGACKAEPVPRGNQGVLIQTLVTP